MCTRHPKPPTLSSLSVGGLARALVGIGVGLALGLLVHGSWRGGPSPPERPRFLAIDRGADRVVKLDRSLIEVGELRASAPLRAVSGGREPMERGKRIWIVEGTGGGAKGVHRVSLLGASRSVELPPGELRSVISIERGDAFVLLRMVGQPGDTLFRIAEGDGALRVVLRGSGALASAARGNRILLGTEDGELELFDVGERVVLARRARVVGSLRALAAGPAGGWWALLGPGIERLGLLAPDLRLRWVRSSGLGSSIPSGGDTLQAVWLVDAELREARRFGPQGYCLATASQLPAVGLGRALSLAEGGLLLTAPGALLELDARGELVRTQGGFGHLCDVILAPPTSP